MNTPPSGHPLKPLGHQKAQVEIDLAMTATHLCQSVPNIYLSVIANIYLSFSAKYIYLSVLSTSEHLAKVWIAAAAPACVRVSLQLTGVGAVSCSTHLLLLPECRHTIVSFLLRPNIGRPRSSNGLDFVLQSLLVSTADETKRRNFPHQDVKQDEKLRLEWKKFQSWWLVIVSNATSSCPTLQQLLHLFIFVP